MNELAAKTVDVTEFYNIQEEIGSGQFAVVKKVIEKETGTEYAAKFMKKKRTKSRRARGVTLEQITREASVLRAVRHEGVIYLHDVFETAQEYVIVLELLCGGELFEFLSEQEYLTEAEAIGFAQQVADAVHYLHEKHIVHLDIKPENIVLKSRAESQVKLIDFGLARVIKPGETVQEMMGTPEFVAPEIIAFEGIGTPTDMWAVGVLGYILVSGASPFLGDSDHETYTNITNVEYDFDEEFFRGISSQAKEFVSALLVKKPRARMTSAECLKHPWLHPEGDFLRRRSTIIKTGSFKEFTARARWKKTMKKVIAVNRMALLCRKDGSVSKDVLFENDHSTSPDSDTEMHQTCHHSCHNHPSSAVCSESVCPELNAETNNSETIQADIKPAPSAVDLNEGQGNAHVGGEEGNLGSEAVNTEPEGTASAKRVLANEGQGEHGKVTGSSGELGSEASVERRRSNENRQKKHSGVKDRQDINHSESTPDTPPEKELKIESGNPHDKQTIMPIPGNPKDKELISNPENSQENELTDESGNPHDEPLTVVGKSSA